MELITHLHVAGVSAGNGNISGSGSGSGNANSKKRGRGGNDADPKGKRPWGSGYGHAGASGSGGGGGGVYITPEEMKARYVAGVCQFCASPNHQRKDCKAPKSMQPAFAGRGQGGTTDLRKFRQ
ncbi:hypothetical protein ABBQ38_007430 [Trebouxia sp. C0009 RCD-2024]